MVLATLLILDVCYISNITNIYLKSPKNSIGFVLR